MWNLKKEKDTNKLTYKTKSLTDKEDKFPVTKDERSWPGWGWGMREGWYFLIPQSDCMDWPRAQNGMDAFVFVCRGRSGNG